MAGRLADRYELERPLGQGAMGIVYLAIDRELDRQVAVKVLPPELADDHGFLARFRREAQAAASLGHPGIGTIHDIGTTPQPFFVMEYVEGLTLAELLRERGPLEPAHAVRLVAGVLDALDHSHARGIVHRDVKPGNIMAVRDGGFERVKVMDFGIALVTTEALTRLTAAGARLGTPSYLSPEQATGEPVGPASDLYSTGCVLYELLTGRPPFQADTLGAVYAQHVVKKPDPPSLHRPGLSRHLDAFVLRALAKKPADRFPSAAAMRDALLDLTASARSLEHEPRGDLAHRPRDGSRLRSTAPAAALGTILSALLAAVSAIITDFFKGDFTWENAFMFGMISAFLSAGAILKPRIAGFGIATAIAFLVSEILVFTSVFTSEGLQTHAENLSFALIYGAGGLGCSYLIDWTNRVPRAATVIAAPTAIGGTAITMTIGGLDITPFDPLIFVASFVSSLGASTVFGASTGQLLLTHRNSRPSSDT